MASDFSEIARLAADLGEVPLKTMPKIRQALEVTARNVKDDARALAAAQSGRHAKKYPAKMEYEMKARADEVWAEVGPRPGGQGDLAPLFETGNPYSGKKPALEPALEYNMDDFLTGLEKAIDDGLAL